MARATTNTLLPLDTFATILELDQWAFNQIGTGFPSGSAVGVSNRCKDTFFQSGWHRDALSREEVARAIARAEDMIAAQLGYYPAPKYFAQEVVKYPSQLFPYRAGGGAWSYSGMGGYSSPQRSSVTLRNGYVWGGGVLARTNIGDTIDLTLVDSDGDSILDSFTCSIATTITDTSEIGVYFRAADRVPASDPIAEQWRIRPVQVTISGGVASIRGHIGLLVKPNLTTTPSAITLNVTTAANFVSQVNVQRVYRDTTQQGNAYWDEPDNCVDEPCVLTTETICIGDRNTRMGQVFIGYDGDTCCGHWRPPDKVAVNYLAGYPLVNNEMDSDMAQIVAALAAGLLPKRTCNCERAERIIDYWREDLSVGTREKAPRALSPHELTSPFGFSRGALYAWERMFDKGIVEAANA